jgi:hypothetical protein
MAELNDVLKVIFSFWEKHESLIGRVAINSARVEREINLLFAYVFNLEYEAWTILARNIPSTPRKIAALKQGLNQEFCKIPFEQKTKLEKCFQSVGGFFAIRNDLIHGQLFPDFESINAKFPTSNLKPGEIESLLEELRKIVDERLSVSEFDPKSAALKYKIYSAGDVETQIESAKTFVRDVQEIMESLKSQYDWVGMRMARSELRKLEVP